MSSLTSTRFYSRALLLGVLVGIGLSPLPGRAQGGFLPTGSMTTPRAGATATLLPNGKVLIAGGSPVAVDIGPSLATAELYDPTTGTFAAAGSMQEPRAGHTATLLANGKVLLVGGWDSRSAELYDPTSGTFMPAGSMTDIRNGHTATLLMNGNVLIAGGHYGDVELSHPLATAELYDPNTGAFTLTGSMAVPHSFHAAALLPDGNVLIAGGYYGFCPDNEGLSSPCATKTAELYDPATGTFTTTGSTLKWYVSHTATVLPNGNVLIAGGWYTNAELYDPATGTFTATSSLAVSVEDLTATLLPNGRVLVAGGRDQSRFVELYDPSNGSFVPTGPSRTGREGHTATLLPNGDVLVAGGSTPDGGTDSAELYRFTLAGNVLLVSKTGNGAAVVTSSPSGIDCGRTCAALFDAGITVTLTATPDPGVTFGGWGGACNGQGTCTVTLAAGTTVTGVFLVPPPPGSLYMISPAPDANLRLIDPGSGAAFYSVLITLAGQAVLGGRGLAKHPVSGQLYALLEVEGVGSNQLAAIDPSGAARLVGPVDDGTGTLRFSDLAFGSDATLYAISGGHTLFRIDPSTGMATFVQQIPVPDNVVGPDGIAYNPEDGLIYHATQSYDWEMGVSWPIWESIDPLSPSAPPVLLPGPVINEADLSKAATALLHRSGSSFLWANYRRLLVVGTDGSVSFLGTLPAPASGMALAAALPSAFPLTVSMSRGSGRVVSVPAGIDCPTTCSAPFATGTDVVLTATPDPGYVFDRWVGAEGGAGGTTYSVGVVATRSVLAMFAPAVTLQVTTTGTGGGTVFNVGDTYCSGSCSVELASGTQLRLRAWEHGGSVFAGWSGDCSGTGFCDLTMDADKSVTATFNLANSPPGQFTLVVTRGGSGAGTVTSSPAGIDCGAACSAAFTDDSVVTFTAEPVSGSVFSGWGGPCAGTGICTVAISSAMTVTATFNAGFQFDSTPPPAQSVRAGQAAQFALTISGQSGFTGTVSFVCTAGVPPGAAWTFNPPSLVPGASTATTVLTITTSPRSTAGTRPARSIFFAAFLLPLSFFAAPLRNCRSRMRFLIALVAILVLVGSMIACGGGSPANSATTTGNAGDTQAGTYTVTVTATSGSTSRTQTVVVVVN